MIAREAPIPYAPDARLGARVCMLDTSVVVGILRRHAQALGVLARLRGRASGEDREHAIGSPAAHRVRATLSTVVRYDAERAVRSPEGRLRLDALLEHTEVVPFTVDDACAAASIDRQLRGARNAIGELDVLIAGAALSRHVPLLTYDVGHFGRVPGLLVWDAASGA